MEEFERHRARLFGVAYRMTGSRVEAEDVVQEAYLRWHRADRQAIREPEAWLVTEAALLALFAPDATWTADGGGQVPAGRKSLSGPGLIVRLVLGLERLAQGRDAHRRLAIVNGETGLTVHLDGALVSVMSFAVEGDRIAAVYNVLNPEKLPVGGPESADQALTVSART